MDSIIEVVFLAVLTVTLVAVVGVGRFGVVVLTAFFAGSKCGASGVRAELFVCVDLLVTWAFGSTIFSGRGAEAGENVMGPKLGAAASREEKKWG